MPIVFEIYYQNFQNEVCKKNVDFFKFIFEQLLHKKVLNMIQSEISISIQLKIAGTL